MDLDKIGTEVKAEVQMIEGQALKAYNGMTKHFDVVHIILIIIAVICITSIGWNVFKPANPVTPSGFVGPPEIRETRTIDRILMPGPVQIVTIEKQVIVDRLKLPDTFKNNTSLQAISTADLKPTKAGYEVVGTINTKTGVGGILAKEKERSFFGLPSNLSVGARYGLLTDGKQEAQVYGKYQPLRVGNTYLGVYGEVNSKPEGKAMIDLEYKWKTD
jgi:hypothetical protein